MLISRVCVVKIYHGFLYNLIFTRAYVEIILCWQRIAFIYVYVLAWPFINTLIRLDYNSRLVCKSLIVVIGWIFLHANSVFLNGDIVKKGCDMKKSRSYVVYAFIYT
jgi:hypothetical protein